jgi:hypothetical protein
MRDHEECAPSLRHKSEREPQHFVSCGFIEIAGGLVCQHQARPDRQGAANRDPLLLSAGELFGIAIDDSVQSKPADQLVLPLRVETARNSRLER